MIRAPFILLVSLVWSALTAWSRGLHRLGVLRSIRLPVRTIAVGNFEAGGTGKTPVVALIAQEAVSRGLHPVILSRGYGGRWEKRGGVLEPLVPGASFADPLDCGDEPALLRERVPEAWIGVGADRWASFERVREQARQRGLPEPDLAILDDGLQHLSLDRDLELVLQTSARPWSRVFREWPGTRRVPALFAWSRGAVPPIGWGRHSGHAIRLKWRSIPTHAVQGSPELWLVTGVADGTRVRAALEEQGWQVSAHSNCRDHARYNRQWVDEILDRARRGGLQPATTGKDWVKWKRLGVPESAVVVFEPELVLDDEGRRRWSRMLWQN